MSINLQRKEGKYILISLIIVFLIYPLIIYVLANPSNIADIKIPRYKNKEYATLMNHKINLGHLTNTILQQCINNPIIQKYNFIVPYDLTLNKSTIIINVTKINGDTARLFTSIEKIRQKCGIVI